MKDGFIRIGAAVPEIRTADCEFNSESIISAVNDAYMKGVRLLVLPELCVTGCTCGDLFLQSTLLNSAVRAVERIADSTAALDMVFTVGAPVRENGKLYNCTLVISRGNIIGTVPKRDISAEESRYFDAADRPSVFVCADQPELCFGIETGNGLISAVPPSEQLALSGAGVILCPSASAELTGAASRRRTLISAQSARLMCAYAYAGAGTGESTAYGVFGGARVIAENGDILAESGLFESGLTIADIDLGRIAFERRRNSGFRPDVTTQVYEFGLTPGYTRLERSFPRMPFVPEDKDECDRRCGLILDIQAHALAKRLSHTGAKKAVIGISGGLDSTLALIVCVKAAGLLGMDSTAVEAVTMPCFGTSDRTRSNAGELCGLLGVPMREVSIADSVRRHFDDISHDPQVRNAAYENAQARERTQVLMDIANDVNGLVVGTGDLSELALGWATYGGDQMSMYGVNASVPKTLIRRIVAYYAETCGNDRLSTVLRDIIDTPVSPELLPAANGEIAQKTEDSVGPYELHDFFLYYTVRYGYPPKKVLRIACAAFEGKYSAAVILKWLKVFCRRFFSQQFKRSCMPDGPAVGTVCLSPHEGWVMPSDAAGDLWLAELEEIRIPEDSGNEHV